LLWIQDGYDRKIIRQLRREFSKEIVYDLHFGALALC
jgi:hypothetical protein